MPVCATPGCLSDTGADWKDLCRRCFARRQASERPSREEQLQGEVTALRVALKMALAENARLLSGGGGKASQPIPEDKLRLLLQLCHPDKHNGSKASTEATSWLISLRK